MASSTLNTRQRQVARFDIVSSAPALEGLTGGSEAGGRCHRTARVMPADRFFSSGLFFEEGPSFLAAPILARAVAAPSVDVAVEIIALPAQFRGGFFELDPLAVEPLAFPVQSARLAQQPGPLGKRRGAQEDEG